jgi:CheY-like chemotaxis protein
MKREGFEGKLAALTGYGQATDMAASRRAGFDAHLTKPVSPQDLLELVAKFTDSSVRA